MLPLGARTLDVHGCPRVRRQQAKSRCDIALPTAKFSQRPAALPQKGSGRLLPELPNGTSITYSRSEAGYPFSATATFCYFDLYRMLCTGLRLTQGRGGP